MVEILFVGKPNVRFVIDLNENHDFNSAVEKIDFVVELLPYHLNPQKLPTNTVEIVYGFDKDSVRWKVNHAITDKQKFVNSDDDWKVVI